MSLWMKTRKTIQNFGVILILIGVITGMSGVAMATPLNPVTIPLASLIDVDGNDPSDIDGEWDLDTDFFADMHEAGKPDTHELLSKLYLRYDCDNETLYAMVLLEQGQVIDETPTDEHFIKIDGNTLVNETYGDNDNVPDFHYITNVSGDKIGWEASAVLTPGTYDLRVHTLVFSGRTSDVEDMEIELAIKCSSNDIPEFPTIALPIAAILGLMFILQSRRRKED